MKKLKNWDGIALYLEIFKLEAKKMAKNAIF